MSEREINKLKKQDNTIKNYHAINNAYITLDLSYDDIKKVRIRKISENYETEEIKKSTYKIDEEETYIIDNQIDLDIYHTFNFSNSEDFYLKKTFKYNDKEFLTQKKDIYKYGGNLYKFEDPSKLEDSLNRAIIIYVSIKNPDEQLNDNLCIILHQLCKKYFKTGMMFTSQEGIMCRMDDCPHSSDDLKNFLEDFVKTTEKTILKEKKRLD
jgi:hypothetical protein